MEGGTVRAGLPYSGDVTLAVPADALPTLTGVSVNKIDPGISWTVIASLDVAKSRDIQHSQEVTVCPAGRAGRLVTSACLCGVQARPMCPHARAVIGRRAFRGQAGRQPAGRDAAGKWACRRSGSELVRIEKFGNVQRDHTADRVVLEPEASLPAGEMREWSFRLNVGKVSAPTLKTDKSSVRWLVKGVLSRRMRRDLRVEREIGVDF